MLKTQQTHKDVQKYLLIGSVALLAAGVAVLYFNQSNEEEKEEAEADEDQKSTSNSQRNWVEQQQDAVQPSPRGTSGITFDPKVHTLEKLKELLHQLKVNQIFVLLRVYREIKELKENGNLDDTKYQQMCNSMQEELDYQSLEVSKQFGVTSEFLMLEWFTKYPEEHDNINQQFNSVLNQKKQLKSGIDSFAIDHFKCTNIPTFIGQEELRADGKGEPIPNRPKGDPFNEDDYVKLFQKVKSKQRYELYKIIKGKDFLYMKIENKENKEFKEKIKDLFEVQTLTFDAEALKLYGFKLNKSDPRPDLVIEECYLDFQSKSFQQDDITKFYSARIKKIQSEHSKIVEKMTGGGVVQEMAEFEDKTVLQDGKNVVLSADPFSFRDSQRQHQLS